MADEPAGIVCAACGCADLRVTHTIRLRSGAVRRYRQCRNCLRRLTTVEAPPALLRGLFPKLFPPTNSN